ncbi:hypothetical protein [Aliiglaciecola litoralis]|uniref:Uncharacterized protein n=1 Tax=Aliiglaciecola litoralis TaxID=582857 RepID=A0ABN1LQK6_9ALTE
MKKAIFSVFLILIILGTVLTVGFDFLTGARIGTTSTVLFDLTKSSLFSQDCKRSVQELLPTLTEEEIALYTVSYPSGIGRSDEDTLRQMIKKSECQRYTPVLVTLGELSFKVPMNFITPWGNYKEKLSTDLFGFSVFMPDYNGYDRRNFIDKFNSSKVQVSVYSESNPPGPEPEVGINRLVNYGLLSRATELDQYDLELYESSLNDRITALANTDAGQRIYVTCSTTTPNKICVMEYHHQPNGYWLILEFRYKHLSKWKEIDSKVNDLLTYWKVH